MAGISTQSLMNSSANNKEYQALEETNWKLTPP
jgi:hypothetical protein